MSAMAKSKISKKKQLEQKLRDALVEQRDIPKWVNYPLGSNFRFNQPTNGMQFDLAWPEFKVAVEINGGQWSDAKMGHNSGKGVERDARKINDAQLLGWILIILVTDHIDKQMLQYAVPTVRRALALRGAPLIDYDKELQNDFGKQLDWEEVNETL